MVVFWLFKLIFFRKIMVIVYYIVYVIYFVWYDILYKELKEFKRNLDSKYGWEKVIFWEI